MKITIEYNNEEREEAMDALISWEYKAFLNEFDHELRQIVKYDTDPDHYEHAQWARERFWKVASDRGISERLI